MKLLLSENTVVTLSILGLYSICWFIMDIVMTIIRPVRLLVCRMTTIRQWQKMEVSELLQESAMEGMDRLLWFFKKGWCAFRFRVLKKLRSILWKWQSSGSRGPETREKFVRRLTHSRKDLFQRYWIFAMRQISRKNLIST